MASSSSVVAQVPGTGPAVGHAVQRACATSRSRARRHRIASSTRSRHGGDVVGRGRRLVEAALAHRGDPHRAVADHAADVDALGDAVDPAEVLAVGRPVPRQAVEDGVARDVLDALHHLGQELAVARACTGANVTPQLPSTTLVTPCQHDDVGSGSHASWASRWVWMSTKPGVTTLAVGVDAPRRPRRRTSARRRRCGRRRWRRRRDAAGAPVPSTTMPLRMTRSATAHPRAPRRDGAQSAPSPAGITNPRRGRPATAGTGARRGTPAGPAVARTGPCAAGTDVVATVPRRDHPRARRHPLGQVGAWPSGSRRACRRPSCYVATGSGRRRTTTSPERIAAHRARRPADWTTVEAGADLVPALLEQPRRDRARRRRSAPGWHAHDDLEVDIAALVDALSAPPRRHGRRRARRSGLRSTRPPRSVGGSWTPR